MSKSVCSPVAASRSEDVANVSFLTVDLFEREITLYKIAPPTRMSKSDKAMYREVKPPMPIAKSTSPKR